MSLLVIGLVIFLGVHSVRIVADPWRSQVIARIGPGAWKLGYSLLSIAGFAAIVVGWGEARQSPQLLWAAPLWLRHAAALFTLAAFVLLAAAYVPRNAIKAAVGHPMIAGVKLWALVHLLVDGTVAGVLLFGSFLVWSIFDFVAARRRDRRDGVRPAPARAWATLITLAIGVAAWAVFAFWLHREWIGVAPFLP